MVFGVGQIAYLRSKFANTAADRQWRATTVLGVKSLMQLASVTQRGRNATVDWLGVIAFAAWPSNRSAREGTVLQASIVITWQYSYRSMHVPAPYREAVCSARMRAPYP